MSISKLDITRYAALFCNQHCKVYDSNKKQLGDIQLSKGLYAIRPEPAQKTLYVGLVNESHPLSMEEIYAWLGHITPSLIHKILKDRVITGMTLNETCLAMDICDAYEYANLMCKPIRKIYNPLWYGKLDDEIHTNFWGPSPV